MASEVIKVLHLYPDELGINGDVGNVMTLAKRAQWRGVQVEVVNHSPGDELPETVHLVHIGSGPISAQNLVREDLIAISPQLRQLSDQGVPFLAIAGGWQLLGRTLTGLDGTISEGAAVFPTDAVLTSKRTVHEYWQNDVAGFVNYGATTAGASGEIFEHGASVATNLHGPFLPMNPVWADALLERAADLAGVQMGERDARTIEADERAAHSREAVRRRSGL